MTKNKRGSLVLISCDRSKARRGRGINFRAVIARSVLILPIVILTIASLITKQNSIFAAPQTITSPGLSVTIDNDDPFTFSLDAGVTHSKTQTLTFNTTSAGGYTINMETGGFHFTPAGQAQAQTILTSDLVNVTEPTDTTKRIPSLTTDTPYNNIQSAYGYHFSSGTLATPTPANTIFKPAPQIIDDNGTLKSQTIKLAETDHKNTQDDTYSLAIAVNADTSIPAGTYQNTLNILITANIADYTVYFCDNKDLQNPCDNPTQQLISEGIPEQLDSNPYTRPGYAFKGWNTKPDGTGTDYIDKYDTTNGEVENAVSGGSVILYAQWQSLEYTVKYDGNTATSGTMNDQTIIYDTPTNLNPNTFTKTDFYFNGWNTKQDGTGDDYADQQQVTNLTTVGNDITLYAQWEPNCALNNICYRDNGANSPTTMGNQSVSASATTVVLWSSNFKYTGGGFGFAGWSEDKNASTKIIDADPSNDPQIYGPNETITKPATMTSAHGLNLYAVWVPSAGSLQNWAGCKSLGSGKVTALTDTRDNNTYAVAKLADDHCWIIENLRLGGSSAIDLTVEDSDLSANYTLPAHANSAAMNATNTLSTTANMTNVNQYVYSYGNYYNYYTAVGGTNISSGNAPTSVCPKGWRLPLSYSANTSDSFSALDKALGGTGNNQTSSAGINQSLKWRTYPNNYDYAGTYTTSLADRGTTHRSWSATSLNGTTAYYISIAASSINPISTTTDDKNFGLSVRCIEREHYTIRYDSNGGSGTMEDQFGFVDSLATLSVNTFTNSTGKYFNGWNTSPDGNGTTYMEKTRVTNLTGAGETITLYAQWSNNIKSLSTMQEITPEVCANTAIGVSATLRDARDNKLYTIKKLADGQCWMTSNLRLGSDTATTLTPNDSDVLFNFTLPEAQTTSASWGTYNQPTDVEQARVYSNDDKWLSGNFAVSGNMTVNTTGTPDTESRYIGNYYNWYTATAGTGLYYNNTTSTQVSICPKGWRLPTGGTTGDFQNLYIAYNSVATDFNSEGTWALGGYYNGSSVTRQGAEGYYWSSTPGSTFSANVNYIRPSSVQPAYNNNTYKLSGYSVRCVARESYTVAFNSNDGSGSMPNQTIYRDVTTKLSLSSFTAPSGKVFAGWNTASDGTGTSYEDEEGVTNLEANGGVIVLYAQWKEPNSLQTLGSLQDMTSEICSQAQVGDRAILTDARDGKKYSIAKLADGKCWMTSNLRLGDTTITLTPSDSDVSADFVLPAAETTTSALGGYNNASYADIIRNYSNGEKYVAGAIGSQMQIGMGSSGVPWRYIGNYYNWYTATAGTGVYSNVNTVAPSSICPKGWRLPTGSNSGEGRALYVAYGSNLSNFLNAGLFSPVGYYFYSGTISSVGSLSYYWSSSAYSSASNSWVLQVNYNSLNANINTYKASSASVRCVAR